MVDDQKLADLEATLEAVGGGAAGSWMLANRGPQMIERDWRPGFDGGFPFRAEPQNTILAKISYWFSI